MEEEGSNELAYDPQQYIEISTSMVAHELSSVYKCRNREEITVLGFQGPIDDDHEMSLRFQALTLNQVDNVPVVLGLCTYVIVSFESLMYVGHHIRVLFLFSIARMVYCDFRVLNSVSHTWRTRGRRADDAYVRGK